MGGVDKGGGGQGSNGIDETGGATIVVATSNEGIKVNGGSGGSISGNGGRATLKITGNRDINKVENWNIVQGGGGGAGGNGEDGDINLVKGGDGGIGKLSQIMKDKRYGGRGGMVDAQAIS